MKIPYLASLFGYLRVHLYILMAKIHWSPREAAVTGMLNRICEISAEKKYRIVDIGCGPGLLASVIKEKDFDYLGIDNDVYTIQYCEDVFFSESRIAFYLGNAESDAVQFNENDIIVLNGVVHHLDDSQVGYLLKKTSSCFAIIIADHLRKGPNLSPNNFLPFILQRLDRGKFIRPYRFFEHLDNYSLYLSKEFPISIAGISCWTYFCNCYRPSSIKVKQAKC